MSGSLRMWMQLWGGVFYLLNKIFFSLKERSEGEMARRWRVSAWVVYIIGLPPWLVILSAEKNWMVTFTEAGGLPSMLLGLVIALRRLDSNPSRRSKSLEAILDRFAQLAAVAGIGFSLYDLGGITALTQWAELGVVVGFLVGTYRLAKDHLDGYLWFLLMNASAGTLVYMEGYKWLALQQALSLAFVLDAYRIKRKKQAAVAVLQTRAT